ncbi:MAG: peptidoglycan editing factor PgeF [Patescibacteria group bacterium]
MLKKSKKGYYFWEEFANMDGLVHGVSTRNFGSIKNNGKINEKNLKNFLNALRIQRKSIIFPEQVHGSSVVTIDDSKNQFIQNVDGLITNKKNIFLGVVTADCLPVIFYDPQIGAVGVAHAGYKGLLRGILQEMIRGMKKLGSDVKNTKIAIGPAIGACCYDVPYDRAEMFVNSDGDSGRSRQVGIARMTTIYQIRKGKYFLDLKNIAKLSLISEGVPENNIEVSDICTKDNIKDFFSFRKEGPKNFGDFATVVGKV